MTHDLRLAELLCSRLCHDVIGPVGAIGNGLELMEESDPELVEDARRLVAQSAEQAWGRLQCLRLAYGGAGAGSVPWDDFKAAAEGWHRTGRVKLELPPAPAGWSGRPAGWAKLVLNVILFAGECLPSGGLIRLIGDDMILAEGKNAALREGAEAALKGETPLDKLDPRAMQAYIAGRSADKLGAKIKTQPGDGRVAFAIG